MPCKRQAKVIYSLPGEMIFHEIMGMQSHMEKLEELVSEKGFILQAFDPNQSPIFIKEESRRTIDLENEVQEFNFSSLNKTESKKDYQELVKNAIEEIKSGAFQKLVASRMEIVANSEELNISEILIALRKKYPDCFIYIAQLEDLNTWLGASPEVLATFNSSSEFSTISLAGTRKALEDEKPSWTDKEIEEQKIVSDFIRDSLEKYEGQLDENGPYDFFTGNLFHLRTDFRLKLNQFDQKILAELISAIHPSPAVSGLAKQKAIEWIEKNEGYERSLYSGFIGPVNANQETSLFVNLRCMQIFREHLVYYAGAGITADSNPEMEYIETKNKINSLKEIINAITIS